jgi:hypothetical protein
MKAPEEPFSLVDEKGEYVNPKFLYLTPGMVVPRIPAYSPNKPTNDYEVPQNETCAMITP